MNKMSKISRIIIAITSLSLIACYFLPVWFIYLMAPQYPEGLTMNIWLNKITGQVDIINGLNHYIGMKEIKAEMFPEFKYLGYILGFYILIGLAVAISGKIKWLFGFLVLLIAAGIAAMVDFYLWGYDYGHNLDPKAAIQIPGFSYQPPLLGHKTLLNFDAYSYPDSGGWFIIVAAAIFMIVWFVEWRKSKKNKNSILLSKKTSSIAAIFLLAFTSCSSGPEPFNYGKDMCADCKMTIMDEKFGAQVITKKGKVFKFDDVHCVVNFLGNGNVKQEDVKKTVMVNFLNKQDFIHADEVVFVVSPEIRSPMNSNAAAFINKSEAEKFATKVNGSITSWNTLKKKL